MPLTSRGPVQLWFVSCKPVHRTPIATVPSAPRRIIGTVSTGVQLFKSLGLDTQSKQSEASVRSRWVIILRSFTMVKRYSIIFCNSKTRVNWQVNFVPFHEDCRSVLQTTMAEQVWISLTMCLTKNVHQMTQCLTNFSNTMLIKS